MALMMISRKKSFEDEVRVKFDNAGDSVMGNLVERTLITPKDGGKPFYRYVVKVGEERKSFLGSFQLDDVLKSLPLGSLIRVTYRSKENIGAGKTVKNFDIEMDDAST